MKETKRKHLMLEVKHFNVQGKFGIFPIRSDFSENGEIFPVGSFPIGNKHCFITKGNVLSGFWISRKNPVSIFVAKIHEHCP